MVWSITDTHQDFHSIMDHHICGISKSFIMAKRCPYTKRFLRNHIFITCVSHHQKKIITQHKTQVNLVIHGIAQLSHGSGDILLSEPKL